MQNGRNPTRRNRNIGTAKQGHGQDNRNKIASVSQKFGLRTLRFIVEHTRNDAVHAVTLDDLRRVLTWLSPADLSGIGMIVLRQPKRREEVLRPVWGRIIFDAQILDYQGGAIMLEAVSTNQVWKWGHHLSPDDLRELQRYRDLGFDVRQTKRHFEIRPTVASSRAMQLYHTLPHEIGHWIQYRSIGHERFWQTPPQEREAFAHRFADAFRNEAMAARRMPFERLFSEGRVARDGMRKEDFDL